jgi:DNA mismatch repair protein MSH6
VLITGSRSKRKVVDDDDESDVFLPDAEPDKEDEEEEAVSIAPSSPSIASEGSSPEPVVRKKSNLSKFNASTPASSSPSTRYSTPKALPTLGAFGKPIDKADRAKNFQEKNKDRYSWLHDIRDKEGNRSSDENYDPRTLFIPASAWKTFTAFEKQYWYVLTFVLA